MSVATSTIELIKQTESRAPMDQVTNLVVNATEDFLKSQIASKDQRIAELEEHIQKVTQRSYAESADRNRITESMQEWTLAALEAGSINETEAEEIAEIVGAINDYFTPEYIASTISRDKKEDLKRELGQSQIREQFRKSLPWRR